MTSDVNAQLPILKALVVLTGLVAVLCLVTIRLRSWRPLLVGVAALVGVAILGGVAYPGLIQRYRVAPNEIVKEKPYIDFNIRYTRQADVNPLDVGRPVCYWCPRWGDRATTRLGPRTALSVPRAKSWRKLWRTKCPLGG